MAFPLPLDRVTLELNVESTTQGVAVSSLIEIIKRHKQGATCGVYSICSANRLVLEAAILQAKKDGSGVLIEATSNQVNQFGGYTGMDPVAFRKYVGSGPNVWIGIIPY
ncbi:class II D-tagatose-bisphosphate aldolase non-catalytic subunit [Endozoicomonas sp.]|uniref:class II D-tagatose-bisphosphate aldolase non-catalytic subunit n=1 Tax=Endozoicomonas sp. TaxID=1892382 RepID=UPI00383A386F